MSDVETKRTKYSETEEEALRFGFGANWADYLEKHYSEERLGIAQRHLLGFLKLDDLKGKSCLDIGCGSGLHSLSAWRAGARPLFSFDYDPKSVTTTRLLRQLAGDPAEWQVVQGSVLDDAFMNTVPKADIVYGWGVLHHTGQMWKAVQNAGSRLHDNSLFYIALYATDAFTDPTPEYWLGVKREYNRAPYVKKRWMDWKYAWNHSIRGNLKARKNPLTCIRAHKKSRGMSYWHDIRDWLGGYPMEFAGNKETEIFCRDRLDLSLINIKAGEANTEFLFCRRGLESQWSGLQAAEPLVALPGPFAPVGGFAWRATVAGGASALGEAGRLMLYENGSPVGWPKAGIDFIQAWGRGRYTVDGDSVVFSATDNTDPNVTAARYHYRRNFI
ncbi:MAG: class I SAM-dependent methyltransferase [Acidobacteriota bacterium]|nr:class I SAM-dependent methyltransferase [Acidobacteriota bacterium]